MSSLNKGGVAIIDFGSQYTQLIARRVREQFVFSEIHSARTPFEEIAKLEPNAIILSGGPSSVYKENAPKFDRLILESNLPTLGICYGLHLLSHHYGGSVVSKREGEFGFAKIDIQNSSGIFFDISNPSKVWMSHGDQVVKIPEGWQVLAKSTNGIVAAIGNENQNLVATQFHPEVYHTLEGGKILSNFLFKIANCQKSWTPGNFINNQVELIRKKVGSKKVIVGVSGGVDSSVVAALLNKAIGKNSIAILIDHGMMRMDEAESCIHLLGKGLGININLFDESQTFLSTLQGVTEPEEKRKTIGNQFIYAFERISKQFGEIEFLAQGTLYPDIIESGVNKDKSAHVIKSHHNVGGLPEKMNFLLIEPLKSLFKDEVRQVGRELGLPKRLIERHPFPGPGLGIRIIGEVNEERLSMLKEADKIYLDILIEDDLYDKIWQAFSVLIPVKTVGVMGDQRTYDNLLSLRAVTSTDGMTADWFHMPGSTLAKVSNRIVNYVNGINRVVYDITSKPPGTIEWE
tara:strand:+ start:12432 stop:13982 length:1551 start_codon:yes stop_codon:yes gene_type:complete